MTQGALNIAAYRFVVLDGLPHLRQRLFEAAAALGLKGTVLLAEEGINLCLAGAPAAVDEWLLQLRRDARFETIEPRRSFSQTQPFQRLKVKIKREIIRMNQPTLQPAHARAPAVSAATLARWMAQGRDDAGRPLRLLDARNAFEVDAGGFDSALDWRLGKFSDFPAALAARADELRGCTVVSYCTGGIRCEKAVLALREAGFAHSFQLDGGILGYFEVTAGTAPGWHGRCVVFDERGMVDASLAA